MKYLPSNATNLLGEKVRSSLLCKTKFYAGILLSITSSFASLQLAEAPEPASIKTPRTATGVHILSCSREHGRISQQSEPWDNSFVPINLKLALDKSNKCAYEAAVAKYTRNKFCLVKTSHGAL